jgi:multiple sugar transport system permease protein
MAALADRSIAGPVFRRGAGLRRALRVAIPHAILILFSAAILLPLLWVLRVSLTDKVNAYRIPPEWTTPKLDNYIEICSAYPFATWVTNSVIVAVASTAIALPLATAMA